MGRRKNAINFIFGSPIERGKVSKQWKNDLKHRFTTGSDSAPQGHFTVSGDISLGGLSGEVLLASRGQIILNTL